MHHIGKHVLLLIGPFLVLLMCVFYVYYAYQANIKPDKQVTQTFLLTECFLLSKKLSSKGHFFQKYRADFRVSYTVNNVEYTRWVSGNGLDASYTHNATEHEDVLSQFENGETYRCWYNPNNPSIVVLVPRHNWTSTFPLMLPAVIFTMMLYLIIRGIRQLTNVTKRKTDRRRIKRK